MDNARVDILANAKSSLGQRRKRLNVEESNIVVWHNPEAVTYYHNKIWDLSKECPPIYEREIKKQLIKWGNWN